MSAATVNPPLPYTKDAIRDHLRHHATNGPAYVQIQATKALARMIGLFEDAKQAAKNQAERIVDRTKSAFHGVKFEGYAAYDDGSDDENTSADDEAASKEEDDVP